MKPKKSKLYYLAGPYTHDNPAIVHHRRLDHMHAEHWLMQQGYDVIAPINSAGALEQVWDLPILYSFWKRRDRKSIKYSDGVIVILLRGWDISVGVKDEIQYAKSLGKPIYYITPKYDINSLFIESFKWSREEN